jgi:dethiobiotin synthetase/adenosylmethionine--8-amino-7-oxononanoate aminotransferase
LKNEKYFIEIPDFNGAIKIVETSFKNLDDVFSLKRADSAIFHNYLNSIEKVFHQIEENKMCIGACLLEGVVLGAGGMKFVDPLFQKILIEESQKRGIPVILDEVFTGFCRLGKRSAAELLNVRPDIACYAKLLTGGLLPMSVTLATEAIFNEFLGDDLTSALLHGHSYTATPIGCQVALEAIDELEQIILERSKSNEIFECWNRDLVNQLSNLSSVERVFSLGTLFVLELKDEKSGYNSSKSKEIIHQLRLFQIEARPLGNVIYLMAGFHTKDIILDSILNKLISTLYN